MKKLILSLMILGMSSLVLANEVKEGSGEGYNDVIKVSVELKDNKIIAIKVLENQDTPRISEPAIAELTKKIIETQSADVDDFAGATYTSEGFKEAVSNALKK
ncbi:FMN-binding protein [Cetobacterium sp. 2A]|uniref:FMN-binding protein n=1 Tax=unclassified Cetobacterium TaxID=2630983 RepID=UPI00163C1AC0|nr:FMN-binding protein [Cetobacterium sp. 2A]MBC2855134.1 FMN-binding protein [Cetobacterium sp. 2A]